MPRQIRDVTRDARRQLASRKEPYWKELRRGLHVGYYKGSAAGSWWLREYCGGKRPKRRLGLADDSVEADGRSVFSEVAGSRRGARRRPASSPSRSPV
jgi:hypothetical protein